MDMTGVHACLFEAVCDVTTVPSHLKLKTGLARDNLFVSSASRICELKNLALDFLNSLLK